MLLTIVLTFFGAAACYRAALHMNVLGLRRMMPPPLRTRHASCWPKLLVGALALFMIVWGVKLVAATWHNTIADFRRCRSASPTCRSRSAAPSCCCFVLERMLIGRRRDPEACATAHRWRSDTERSAMEILVLLATMFVCFVIGVPIAYSLALAAIAGACGSTSRSRR